MTAIFIFFLIVWKGQHGISKQAANKGLNIALGAGEFFADDRSRGGGGRQKTEVGDGFG